MPPDLHWTREGCACCAIGGWGGGGGGGERERATRGSQTKIDTRFRRLRHTSANTVPRSFNKVETQKLKECGSIESESWPKPSTLSSISLDLSLNKTELRQSDSPILKISTLNPHGESRIPPNVLDC